MLDNESNNNDGLLIIFALIAVLFTSISGVQAYFGYSSLLGSTSAAIFSFVMSLAVLMLNFSLRKNRVNNQETLGVSITLFIVIFFMFLGDFTAIYKRFAGANGIAEAAVEKNFGNFQENMILSKSKLSKIPAVKLLKEKKENFEIAITNFKEQCADPLNPGIGTKASRHLEEIEGIINRKITKLKPPIRLEPININEFIEYCDKTISIARDFYTKTTDNSDKKAGEYKRLISFIENQSKYHKEVTSNFIRENSQDQETAKQIIIEMKGDSQEVKRELETLGIPTKEFKEITPDSSNFNEISQAFSSAFIDREKPITTLIVLLITLLINFLVPLITFVHYKPNQDRRIESNTCPSSKSGLGGLN